MANSEWKALCHARIYYNCTFFILYLIALLSMNRTKHKTYMGLEDFFLNVSAKHMCTYVYQFIYWILTVVGANPVKCKETEII